MAFQKVTYTDNQTVISAKNLNDIQDAILALEEGLFAIDNYKSGEAITVTDAAQRGVRRLKMYGKTTQGGTPTPEAPVDLVSSIDGDSVSIHVTGKNMFTGWIVGGVTADTGADFVGDTKRRTAYLPVVPGQKIAISGIPSTLYNMAAFYDADKVYISRSAATGTTQMVYDVPAKARYFRITLYENSAVPGKISEVDAMAYITMIEAGPAATEYVRSKPIQTATISTPNGLHGIPVSSGGNYTDASGQQWYCDEIDLARGVLVQRCFKETVTPTYNTSNDRYDVTLTHNANLSFSSDSGIFVMCDKLPFNRQATAGANGIRISTAVTNLAIAYYNGENPGALTLVYPLETPIETKLSEANIATYNELYTYRDYASISNSGHAYMELEYAIDAKMYIDRIVTGGGAARVVSIALPASAWTGSGNLYSQVVSISGTTANSQVNLTPSVEQLSIFYEKDITFTTENNGGVITVYVIGQKPANDYVIQADIVEVIV